MRADIHDGPEQTLQSEAGCSNARPHHQLGEICLHRTAGPYRWVNIGHSALSALAPGQPVSMRRRTSRPYPAWSASSATSGHKLVTSAGLRNPGGTIVAGFLCMRHTDGLGGVFSILVRVASNSGHVVEKTPACGLVKRSAQQTLDALRAR